MPAISSAIYRVTFKRSSLTDPDLYWQDFSITLGLQAPQDFMNEMKKLGFLQVQLILISVVP